MPMKLIRAEHLGFCFGVRDALKLAQSEAAESPITVLGDLVHNNTVLADLHRQGVQVERDLEAVATQTVMITAHGASRRRVDQVKARGHRVIEATCPLVHHAHQSLAGMVARGYHPVVVGQAGHVEVVGLTEDFTGADVVLSQQDIDQLQFRPRFGVISQTTQPVARVRALVDYLRHRFPASEVLFRDTVCQPTKLRQSAAESLARQCDVVVVIGGAHSNNTRQLVQTCGQFCTRVHHVQTAADLCPTWFRPEDIVGVTAGTSTPDILIHSVEQTLRHWDHDWSTAKESSVSSAPLLVEALL